jgi:hypothetical protein
VGRIPNENQEQETALYNKAKEGQAVDRSPDGWVDEIMGIRQQLRIARGLGGEANDKVTADFEIASPGKGVTRGGKMYNWSLM